MLGTPNRKLKGRSKDSKDSDSCGNEESCGIAHDTGSCRRPVSSAAVWLCSATVNLHVDGQRKPNENKVTL